MCNSISCKWNRACRCTKKSISIYDNTIIGLCLNHTEDIQVRVLDAFTKGREIGAKDGEIKLLGELTEDMKLLKNPKEFDSWMQKKFGKK